MKKGHIFFLIAALAFVAGAGQAQAVTLTGTAAVNTPVAVVNATTTATTTTTVGAGVTTGAVGVMAGNDATASADLVAVTGTIKTTNPAIVAVDTTNDAQVSVTYDRPAKLFGFIETKMNEKATITTDASGKAIVSVEKPWWSFLAASQTDSTGFASAIQARLDASATTMNTATVDGKLSASAKAYLLTQIEAAAEATYSANAAY